MKSVFIVADNILSPIGNTSAENFDKLTQNISGVKEHSAGDKSAVPFYASLFSDEHPLLAEAGEYTKFEQLLIASVTDALKNSGINSTDKKTVLIISTTKGNISMLETDAGNPDLNQRIALPTSARLVSEKFGFVNKPLIVSHACISGLMAMITGMRLIQAGQYDNAVVVGGDVITRFVLSGFQSFQAISAQPCKPFDLNRDGINLGEGAATVILSSNQQKAENIQLAGGSVSNDANHISGPSKTGEELFDAINSALKSAGVESEAIDFISAHGTATVYNDEMEAKAINLAGMQDIPVNSLKGYYGHTLGASGLIEAIIATHSLKHNIIIPTRGFHELGVTQPLNVAKEIQTIPLTACLKTASGFGGCNAAIVLRKS
ncbi:beta-ketoacyl synthase N-terminal-like domain-containing protein [Mucilaginibacter sp. OK283]|jgi:3-oxoacyl-[acyl-carrier-protein] synthase-1|uniref:beta-ketoacyl synthase N-terminal-like domain-containing protein n=1 Tax=Mucilaginibacter sp. OK283 TaxID=1881049 RepID=UPI0008C8A948|nr:beta-ketoacyl synthase N-terminal-like domain-containing protein [Mucilaginibacter sp. OK283]SEO03462.1 3-oxoacyl-[acyl-carrier-protein] synthase-1 [Mucilaginibacter sp. OK283]